MNEFIVIIPSRLSSTRLKEKPLLDLNGKSLIERVYLRAIQSNAKEVFIATDSKKIEDHNSGIKHIRDKKIVSIANNYKPDLILFGHNNSLSRTSIISLKEKFRVKIALWYEDHVMKGDPSYRKNLDLIEKNKFFKGRNNKN